MAQVDQPALKYDTAVVPRMMVRAMFALVAVILLLVSLARLTDQPLSAIPPESEAVLSRTVFLSGQLSGAAKVMDANMDSNLVPLDIQNHNVLRCCLVSYKVRFAALSLIAIYPK